ncbi:MAG: hypothetical protein ACO3EE_04825 [Flavobacteriales bacterium]
METYIDDFSLFAIEKMERQIKKYVWIFIVGLVLSGLSAIPLVWGVDFAVDILDEIEFHGQVFTFMKQVQNGLTFNEEHFPFMAYGTDWLAFAHFMFALLFVGLLFDAERNRFILRFGMVACVLIIPTAVFFGHAREIPWLWRMIDCSFGVVGFAVLLKVELLLNKLCTFKNKLKVDNQNYEKSAA